VWSFHLQPDELAKQSTRPVSGSHALRPSLGYREHSLPRLSWQAQVAACRLSVRCSCVSRLHDCPSTACWCLTQAVGGGFVSFLGMSLRADMQSVVNKLLLLCHTNLQHMSVFMPDVLAVPAICLCHDMYRQLSAPILSLTDCVQQQALIMLAVFLS
jgi:hypothetical protein